MSDHPEYSLAIDTRDLNDEDRAALEAAIARAKEEYSISTRDGLVAADQSGPAPEDAGVTFLIITGIVVGIGLILRALPFGQEIDLRTDPPKTRVRWGLNSKLMIVIGVDGTVEIKANEAKDVLDEALNLVLEMFRASKKTVDDIADAVKQALKDKVSVTPTKE